MKKVEGLVFFIFLTLAGNVFCQQGTLDLSYGTNGSILTNYASVGYRYIVDSSVMQQDGKVVLMGRYGFPASNVDQIGISRHNTDGTLDNSFGSNGFISINVNNKTFGYSITLQQDDKIIVAGKIITSATTTSLLVIRLNPNGNFDNSFGNNGIALFANNSIGYSVKTQLDNKIIVGGQNLDGDFTVVRLNPDGTLDNDFGFNGVVSTTITLNTYESQINALNLQSDGKIVASGFTSLSFTDQSFCIVRYNIDGSIDTSFGTNGKVITDVNAANADLIYAQAIQQDGKIVVTGTADTATVVARYNTNGTLDTTFGTNGITTTSFGDSCISRSLLIQPDNKIVIVGESFLPIDKYLIARYSDTGILDTTFNSTGYNLGNFTTNNNCFDSVLMQPDGKLLATGWNQIGNNPYTTIARFNSGLNLNNDVFEKDLIKVYPNPTKEKVMFDNTTYGFKKVTVFNYLGQQVLKTIDDVCSQGLVCIDLSSLSAGSYIIQMEGLKGVFVVKLIKK
jgi:uncharacterized delta-60 repeat protein